MRTLVALTILLTSFALGDSAVMHDLPGGRTAAVTGTERITMSAEKVLVYPAGGLAEVFLPELPVECVLHLVNRSDQTVNVTVGFPIDAIYGDSYTVMPESMLLVMLDSLHAGEGRRPWILTGALAAYRLAGWYDPCSPHGSQRAVDITREAVEAYRAGAHFDEGGPR